MTGLGIATPNETSQYAQNYTTMPNSSAKVSRIGTPVEFNLLNNTLTSTYLGTLMQVMLSAQYAVDAHNASPSLWIQEAGGSMQYIEVSQGAKVTLLALSPMSGNGSLCEMLNGTKYNYSFHFYRRNQLTFNADTIGHFAFFFDINGKSSNKVTINVVAYTPPQYYPTPDYYRQSYYYPGLYYPYYEFGRHWPRFWSGHNWYEPDYPWLTPP